MTLICSFDFASKRVNHYRALQLMIRIDFSNVLRMLDNFDSQHFKGGF